MRILAVILLTLALPTLGASPDSIVVGGAPLRLNGAGVRVKEVPREQRLGATALGPMVTVMVPVNVYAAALYLPQRMSDAGAVVALDGPKAVRVTFLRKLDRATVLGILKSGIRTNSPGQAAEVLPKLEPLASALPENVASGDVLLVSYAPGTGSALGLEGKPPVTVEGKAFADALFRIWFGPSPADAGLVGLRNAMLGGAP